MAPLVPVALLIPQLFRTGYDSRLTLCQRVIHFSVLYENVRKQVGPLGPVGPIIEIIGFFEVGIVGPPFLESGTSGTTRPCGRLEAVAPLTPAVVPELAPNESHAYQAA